MATRTHRVIVLLTDDELAVLDALTDARYWGTRSKAIVDALAIGVTVLTAPSSKGVHAAADALKAYCGKGKA